MCSVSITDDAWTGQDTCSVYALSAGPSRLLHTHGCGVTTAHAMGADISIGRAHEMMHQAIIASDASLLDCHQAVSDFACQNQAKEKDKAIR